jgi:hypothetical protein
MAASKYEKGDKVTTVHGEKLTILDVKTQPIKRKGNPTGKNATYVMAKSGGVNTWFPVSRLGKKGGNK